MDPRSAQKSDGKDSAASCAVVIQLEGLPYEFSLLETDLTELCNRYGPIRTLQLLDNQLAPDIALAEFQKPEDAQEAIYHLDGMVITLDGMQCVVRVNPFNEDMDRMLQKKLETAAASALTGPGGDGIGDGTHGGKWCCRFVIGAEAMNKDFPVVGRIIGPNGEHMKTIHEATGAKLRLRGRRSNYREGPEQKESDDPLHLCVSAGDEVNYRRSCEMVESLMAGVYQDYTLWCNQRYIQLPAIQLICVEGNINDPLEPRLQDLFSRGQSSAFVPPNAPHQFVPSKQCRNFAAGHCPYGDRCTFAHSR